VRDASAAPADARARGPATTLDALVQRIVACEKCPRLREYCQEVARVKRRAFRDEEYWGRPVPSFGDTDPALLIVGLAPAAHGGNRTGRTFTGDSSGDWLYRELHEAGFANQAEATAQGDGLVLTGARITSAARCAPPDNKPTAMELDTCRAYLVEEMRLHENLAVVLALGRIGFDAALRAGAESGRLLFDAPPRFAHGAEFSTSDGRITLLASYHPSRQNTQTGRLTRAMFRAPFQRAREIVNARRGTLR
jgi:uracil-DNA glycosylase family 4